MTITLRHVWFPHYSWYIKICRKKLCECFFILLYESAFGLVFGKVIVWHTATGYNRFVKWFLFRRWGVFPSGAQWGASTNIFPNILKEYISKYLEIIYFQIIYMYLPNIMLFLLGNGSLRNRAASDNVTPNNVYVPNVKWYVPNVNSFVNQGDTFSALHNGKHQIICFNNLMIESRLNLAANAVYHARSKQCCIARQ